jgi:hypothetical protein
MRQPRRRQAGRHPPALAPPRDPAGVPRGGRDDSPTRAGGI